MGIESDTATGWAATDWFEDLVMRYGGPDDYNKWVKNDIKFDSPLVKEAAAEFQKLMFTDGNVLGGRKAIASTNFGTAGNPMFDAKPGCWMYKQGSFITGFFPKKVNADLDTASASSASRRPRQAARTRCSVAVTSRPCWTTPSRPRRS